MSSPLRVAVAGAGLAGSMMACYLTRAGHQVDLLERRPDPRKGTAEAGRSINLALSHRGIRALAGIGLDERVLARAVPMRGRMMHATDGSLSLQPYGIRPDEVIHSVSRGDLNVLMLDAAEQAGARIRFSTRVRDVDPERGTLLVDGAGEESGGPQSETYDLIIGADGAFSAVRARLQRHTGFDYQQSYLEHGYKELEMPPAPGGGFALDRNALHIWPRGGFMMIALPNEDATFTCTLFWPMEGEDVSFAAVPTGAEAVAVFERHFPDALELFPNLVEQFETNPVGSLVTVRCRPWDRAGKVVLIGDAAHAVVPFYGQGMNASFEDCRLLAEALGSGVSTETAISAFARLRKPNTDALADLALDNYVTMRDRVASRGFLWLRALGRMAHRLFPQTFLPLYSMVTFTSIPYAEAVERWERQVRVARWGSAALGALVLILLLLLLR